MMLSDHDVTCTLVQHRRTQAVGTCSMMYRLPNSRYQYSHRCFTSWRCISRTSQSFRCPVARLTNRPYVIPEVNRSSDLDSFVSAISTSMHDPEYTTLEKLARKLQAIHRWGSQSLGELALGELQNSSLRELARKLQARLVRIQSRWHKRLL